MFIKDKDYEDECRAQENVAGIEITLLQLSGTTDRIDQPALRLAQMPWTTSNQPGTGASKERRFCDPWGREGAAYRNVTFTNTSLRPLRLRHHESPESHLTSLLEELWAYNLGIGRNKGIPVIVAGGIENHIHLLIELSPTLSIAEAISKFKSNSSRWMKTKGIKNFSWQTGYGAFSVGAPQLASVTAYIRNQREHHKTQTYEEEFIGFLKRAGIEFDPNQVFN